MAEAGKLFVIKISSGKQFGPIQGVMGDMDWPEEVTAKGGWTVTLDCRHAPYTEKSLEELRHFAYHVNKPYILVTEAIMATAEGDSPPISVDEGNTEATDNA